MDRPAHGKQDGSSPPAAAAPAAKKKGGTPCPDSDSIPHASICRAAGKAYRDAAAYAHRAAAALNEWAEAAGDIAAHWTALSRAATPADSYAAGRVCAATRAAQVMDASMVHTMYAGYVDRHRAARELAVRAAAAAGIRFDVDVGTGGRPLRGNAGPSTPPPWWPDGRPWPPAAWESAK